MDKHSAGLVLLAVSLALLFIISFASASDLLCYQESANVSNQGGVDGSCRLNYTGAYIYQPDETGSDGNWNTGMGTGLPYIDAYLFINYTKPSVNTSSAIWQVKYNNAVGSATITNFTLPSRCIDAFTNTVALELYIVRSPQSMGIYCRNNTAFEYIIPQFNITTIGEIYEEALIWNIGKYIINDVTYKNSTYEFATEDFALNLTYDNDSYTPSAYLVYNNISYVATQTGIGNTITFSKTLSIPHVNATSNIPFYWTILLSGNSSTSYYNSTFYTQTVYPLTLDNCTNNSIQIFNFTMLDEASRTPLNATLSGTRFDIEVLISSPLTPLINKRFALTNPIFICINNNFTLTNDTYRMDIVATYDAIDYVTKFYYVDNGTISHNTIPIHIDLHNLPLADSKTFLFTFYDQNYGTHPNAIVQVLRKYIDEGVFHEVERGKLDNNGQTHLHLVEEDVIYMFNITEQGRSIYISDSYNAKCIETPCQIVLNENLEGTAIDGQFDNLPDGTYSLTSDRNTRTVTLDYNLNAVGLMTLDVYKYTSSDTDTLVGTNSLTSDSGTISVAIPVSYDNSTFYAVVSHDNSFVTSKWVDMSESGFPYFGTTGLLMAGILILTLGLISVSSGGWTLVFGLIGVLIAMATKLMEMDYYLYVYVVCLVGLVVWKLATRRTV